MRLVLAILLIIFSSSYAAAPLYSFATVQQKAQFFHLLKDLRCLVCQNQDLADSNAALAQDLRQQIYTMVQEGKADRDIIEYLTKRYGDFILFNPPLKSLTLMLWFGPIAFLLVGIILCQRYVQSKGD